MQELLALVKFNDNVALVMKEKIKLTYNRYNDAIIGRDETGVFFDCLYYERPIGKWKAFAGREFDIELENGEIVHCNGQWWSGLNDTAREIINQDLASVTAKDIESLKKCYVFNGFTGLKTEYQKLIDSYDGKIYGYREYEDIIKNR
ncbi:hypothetical protein P9294_gp009 [Bacillus phage FADO]|uniref:Uncharacterized protein n=1 Tax=Bacillus phage FADO TaxID=2917160 RepID=A0AAE9GCB6_9CAUD|nr:hypothetical protein P9294_gp009 [Bacillus phage FADO]UNY48724.1 hypothetical protein fado_9 [Bacillus phage FADO]